MIRDAVLIAALMVTSACSPARTPGDATETSGEEPATVDATSAPADTALLWVAVEDSRELVLVDTEARRVLQRFGVLRRPHNLTVTSDGVAAATLQQAGTVALVRKGSASTVELGGSPHDVKPTRDGLIVTNEGARRLEVLAEDGKREASIDLKADPHDVAVRGDIAWVSLDDTDEIAVVDLQDRKVERYVKTGKRPHDLRFDDEDRAWVTDWDGMLHVFDDKGALVKTLTLGSEAHHLAFTPDGTEGWVTDHGSRRAYVVSTKTLEVTDTLPVPGAPHHVAITQDGKWAGVADHDRGSLMIFDVSSRREVGTVRVGSGPHGVWPANA